MDRVAVECLCCGQRRIVGLRLQGLMQVGECPRCGYLGWAHSSALTEKARGALRRRPVQARRLYAVG